MWQKLTSRYQAFKSRELAKLSDVERADIIAFDQLVKRYWLHYLLVCMGLLLLIAIVLRFWNPGISHIEAAVITMTMFIALTLAPTSAWFLPGYFRLSPLRSFLNILVFSIAGAYCGALLVYAWKNQFAGPDVASFFAQRGRAIFIAGLTAGLAYAGLIVIVALYRRRQLIQRNAVLEAQARSERLSRQLTEARLKLLQAQVEPHFLFNTLASAKHLAENKAPEAAQLIDQLIVFLRNGMAGLRSDKSTLGLEIDIALAYLNIMQTRMGERLAVCVEVSQELSAAQIPPAILISLVENAVKHGLEPLPQGGEITLSARRTQSGIELSVADNGVGLSGPTGAGVGLANIRERLEALYGAKAALDLFENSPRGFRATLSLPYELAGKME